MEPPSNQSFYRGSDRILGGVCSGLAEGFHVEVLWVRVAFVLLLFLQGTGLVLYVVLWVLMPERTVVRPAGRTVFASMSADVKRAWADLRTQFAGSRPAVTAPAPVDAETTPPRTQTPRGPFQARLYLRRHQAPSLLRRLSAIPHSSWARS